MITIRTPSPVATLDSPINHLAACHRRIEERLDTLERVSAHLRSNTKDALAAIQSAIRFFDSSGVNHTADEEESFFPRLSPHLAPDERQFLADLEAEHSHADALYGALKNHVANMADPPTGFDQNRYAELALGLCTLYRRHIQNEDARFPRIAAQTLSAADLEAIGLEMKQRRGL